MATSLGLLVLSSYERPPSRTGHGRDLSSQFKYISPLTAQINFLNFSSSDHSRRSIGAGPRSGTKRGTSERHTCWCMQIIDHGSQLQDARELVHTLGRTSSAEVHAWWGCCRLTEDGDSCDVWQELITWAYHSATRDGEPNPEKESKPPKTGE